VSGAAGMARLARQSVNSNKARHCGFSTEPHLYRVGSDSVGLFLAGKKLNDFLKML
jgi:hypothetical protein